MPARRHPTGARPAAPARARAAARHARGAGGGPLRRPHRALAQLAVMERLGFSRQPLGAGFAAVLSAFVALADDRPLNAEASATAAAENARRGSSRLLSLRALLVAGLAQKRSARPTSRPSASARRGDSARDRRHGSGRARGDRAARERRHDRRAPGAGGVRADAAPVRDRVAGRGGRDQPRGRRGAGDLRAHRQHAPASSPSRPRRDPPHRARDGARAAPRGLEDARRRC